MAKSWRWPARALPVSQSHPYAKQVVRRPDGTWQYLSYEGLNTSIRFPSIALEMTMAALYQRVAFPS